MKNLNQFEVQLKNNSFIDIIQRRSFKVSFKFYYHTTSIMKLVYLAALLFSDQVIKYPKEFLFIEASAMCVLVVGFVALNYHSLHYTLKFIGIFPCASKELPILFLAKHCWQIVFTAVYLVMSRFICSCSFLLTTLILSPNEKKVVDETFVLETMNKPETPNFIWGILAYAILNVILFYVFVHILKYDFSDRTEFFRFLCSINEKDLECTARPDSVKIFDCHNALLYTPDLRNEFITFLAGNIVLLGQNEQHLIPEGLVGKIVVDLADSQKEFSYNKEQKLWLANPRTGREEESTITSTPLARGSPYLNL